MHRIPEVLIIFFALNYSVLNAANENTDKSKSFVEQLGKKVIETVSDEKLSDSQRYNNFKNIYLKSFDNFYISRFVLGRYWKKLDKSVKTEFIKTFNDYIVSTYAPKFKGWQGEFKASRFFNRKKLLQRKNGCY